MVFLQKDTKKVNIKRYSCMWNQAAIPQGLQSGLGMERGARSSKSCALSTIGILVWFVLNIATTLQRLAAS